MNKIPKIIYLCDAVVKDQENKIRLENHLRDLRHAIDEYFSREYPPALGVYVSETIETKEKLS